MTAPAARPVTAPDLEALRAEVAQLQKAEDAAKEAAAAAAHALAKARLRLFEAEGKGNCLDARWIRAWLGGDHAACERLSNLRYPYQADVRRPVTEEERAALMAEAQRLEAEGKSIAG